MPLPAENSENLKTETETATQAPTVSSPEKECCKCLTDKSVLSPGLVPILSETL